MRRAAYAASCGALLGLGLLAGLVSADFGAASTTGRFVYSGEVTKVVDGDTLDVRLSAGKLERVRLVGIDTPERGACYFSQAGNRARALALRRKVTLRGDATQDTRDRYGRLLAYVDIAGGGDLGATLIREGYGRIYVYSHAFARLSSYRTSQLSAKSGSRGLWGACGATTPTVPETPPPTTVPAVPVVPVVPAVPTTAAAPAPPAGGCHPSYSNCLPIVGDLNCPDVRAMGKAPVQVLGSDPYRLDADNDGLGCE